MKIMLLSDIHGNLNALKQVLNQANDCDAFILLGDSVDYGPHSNEVIELLKNFLHEKNTLCNLCGNHEQSIICGEYHRFSSERGKQCAQNTRENLTETSWNYLNRELIKEGYSEFTVEGKKCLAVHGSLEDVYWKPINFKNNLTAYRGYDYVFSGHSHLPHFLEVFFESDESLYRNKTKTIFINPGSVGQPRNHNPMAQYVILDILREEISFKKILYDIRKEQFAFSDNVDNFYRQRLEVGI